jgi:hypothetical protein
LTAAPEHKPAQVSCTRCWRDSRRSNAAGPSAAPDDGLGSWHQTPDGWVCEHCWTELDRRHELGLCELCGRAAQPSELESGGEWRRPGGSGDLICPECEFGGRDSIIVHAAKNGVRRWQQTGDVSRYQALVDSALAREREIIIAMLRARIEREGATLDSREWEELIAGAVEAARRRWPKPVGES